MFTGYISPFRICCKVDLVMLNSINFCLSVKLLISPSILNEIFAEYSNLDGRVLSFSTLNISCRSFLACRVSAERSTGNRMSFPLCVTCFSSLDSFNTLSLCLFSVSLINVCLDVLLLGLIL